MKIEIHDNTVEKAISFQAECAAEQFQLEALHKACIQRGLKTYQFDNSYLGGSDVGFGIILNSK